MAKAGLAVGLCPFPHAGADGVPRRGWALDLDRSCVKCATRSCVTWARNETVDCHTISHFVCEFGLVSYRVRIVDERLLVVGVYDRSLTLIQDRQRRKRLTKERTVTTAQIATWATEIGPALESYAAAVQEEVQVAIAPLHDLKAAVGMLQRNVEAVVTKYPGESIEEKIDRTEDRDIIRLLKTATVVAKRLELMSIVNNPAAASYGRPRPGQIYRIFHKFVRLFEPMAAERRINLSMEGGSYADIPVYDSFESIPLILLDNAVKYSEPNWTVRVLVEEHADAVEVRVSSYGKIVPQAERALIFQRGARGTNTAKAGTGLGLYIADTVAHAHGSRINYDVDMDIGGNGWNHFSIALPRQGGKGRNA